MIVPLEDQFPGSNSNHYSVQHWADVSDGRSGVALASVDAHIAGKSTFEQQVEETVTTVGERGDRVNRRLGFFIGPVAFDM